MEQKYIDRSRKVIETRTSFKFKNLIKIGSSTYGNTVEVECEKGHTLTRALSSLVKTGCSACSGKEPKRYTLAEIQAILRERNLEINAWYGDSVRDGAILECRICGYEYEVKTLHASLKRNGCKKCAKQVQLTPWELTVEAAKSKWSLNWVEYDEALYTNSIMKARCQKCGNKHSGAKLSRFVKGLAVCEYCDGRFKGFKSTEPATLYYLRIQDDYKVYYKIGITNRTVQDRFSKDDLEKITVLSELHYEEGWKALKLEQYFLQTSSEYRYQGSPILASGGNTELFVKDVLELDSQPSP